MDKTTQIGIATLVALFTIIWAWRRYGLLGGIGAAVLISALAGAYVPAIKSVVLSASRLWETPANLVQHWL